MTEYLFENCGWLHYYQNDPEYVKFCEERKINWYHYFIIVFLSFFGSLLLEKKFCKRKK